MDSSFVVAQAIGNQPSGTGTPPRTVKLTKPQGNQPITINLDGSMVLDFSAIANENITLVHVGDRLVILFDNQTTITLDPFYDASGQPLQNLTVELGPDRDVTGSEFANLFPVTTDQSVLPAAGGTPAAGAYFLTFTVEALTGGTPLPLLGPESLNTRGPVPLDQIARAGWGFGAAPRRRSPNRTSSLPGLIPSAVCRSAIACSRWPRASLSLARSISAEKPWSELSGMAAVRSAAARSHLDFRM
jgi:hypothetical protein